MMSVGTHVHVRNSYLCATDSAGAVLAKGRRANTLWNLAERGRVGPQTHLIHRSPAELLRGSDDPPARGG
jgi:hypothetical protein